MGFKTMKMGWEVCLQSSLVPIWTPSPCSRILYLDLPIQPNVQKSHAKLSQLFHTVQRHILVACQMGVQENQTLNMFILTGSICIKMAFSQFACQIQWHFFRMQYLDHPEVNQIQTKISHFVDFDWEKCIKIAHMVHFRVQGMPNTVALVASLHDKWFMKNHNFRRHIAENGVQNHENGMGHMQQSSLVPILPLHHVAECYILTFP